MVICYLLCPLCLCDDTGLSILRALRGAPSSTTTLPDTGLVPLVLPGNRMIGCGFACQCSHLVIRGFARLGQLPGARLGGEGDE